jgi:hypothetical protein
MSINILTDTKGRKIAAVVPWKDYKKMLEKLEAMEDIKLYDDAKKKKSDLIPAKEAFKMLDAKRKRK